jgi:DNA-binding transcriptional MerR regulator
VYSRRDVETAMIIKKLLYEDRFSIEGARSRLRELRSKVKEERVHSEKTAQIQSVEVQKEVLSEALVELCAIRDELLQFKTRIA